MIYIDEECPLCRPRRELWLNQSDLFECPGCHLQLSFLSYPQVALLAKPGSGDFRSRRKKVPAALLGSLLSPAQEGSILAQKRFFQEEAEVRAFLKRPARPDTKMLMPADYLSRLVVSDIQRDNENRPANYYDYLLEWLDSRLPGIASQGVTTPAEDQAYQQEVYDQRSDGLQKLAAELGLNPADPFRQAEYDTWAADRQHGLKKRLLEILKEAPFADLARTFAPATQDGRVADYRDLISVCTDDFGGFGLFLPRLLGWRILWQRLMRYPFYETGDIPSEWMGFFVSVHIQFVYGKKSPIRRIDPLLVDLMAGTV